jgi:hypothetical protein
MAPRAQEDSDVPHDLDTGPIAAQWNATRVAHALLASIAITTFVLSAVLLRLFRFRNVVTVHAYLQLFGIIILISGIGSGIWLADQHNGVCLPHYRSPLLNEICLYSNQQWWWISGAAHEIIGVILLPLAFAPLVLGYLQHRYWTSYHETSWRNKAHVWCGRAFIFLGMVTGFLPNVSANIYYIVIMALLLLLWIYAIWRWSRRERREARAAFPASAVVTPMGDRVNAAETNARDVYELGIAERSGTSSQPRCQ